MAGRPRRPLHHHGRRAGAHPTSVKRSSPAFIAEMNERVIEQPSGTAFVQQDEEPRIVSWKPLSGAPGALRHQFAAGHRRAYSYGRARAWITAFSALAVTAVFWVLAWFIFRWTVARQEAEANALAVREVNHRVKNSLQLMSSLMHIRARKSDDPAFRAAAKDLTSQLTALAETYRFVQSAKSLEAVDAAVTLQGLCRHLEDTYGVSISVDAKPPLAISRQSRHGLRGDRQRAGHQCHEAWRRPGEGVAVRRLVTRCSSSSSSDRGQLPDGFNVDEQKGFGLKAVRSMLQSMGGRLTAANRGPEPPSPSSSRQPPCARAERRPSVGDALGLLVDLGQVAPEAQALEASRHFHRQPQLAAIVELRPPARRTRHSCRQERPCPWSGRQPASSAPSSAAPCHARPRRHRPCRCPCRSAPVRTPRGRRTPHASRGTGFAHRAHAQHGGDRVDHAAGQRRHRAWPCARNSSSADHSSTRRRRARSAWSPCACRTGRG